MDEAQTVPYEVLLSYPSSHGVVNQISLLDEQGKEQFVTVGKQPALGTAEEAYNEVLPNFNAYSVPGVVEVSELKRRSRKVFKILLND